MKAIIQEFSELSDSRELLESKPYPAGTYFTYILIAVILLAILWASISEIDIVVKANGVVRPLETVSTISNISSGKIIELNFENGDVVKEGDVLFKINSQGLNIQQDGIQNQIIEIETEIEYLELLKRSVEEKTNLFSINEGDISESYYYKYKKYELDSKRVNENINLLTNKVERTKISLSSSKEYLESIEIGSNKFTNGNKKSEFYQKYNSFLLNKNEIQMSMSEAENNFSSQKKLYDVGSLSKKDFDKSKLQYDQYKNKYAKYISDTKVSIKGQIESYKNNLLDYEGELSKLVPEFKSDITNDNVKSIFETETLIGINNQLQENKQALKKLKVNNESVLLNVDKTVIKAPISGRIDYVKELAIGDFLSAGTTIGTIVPKNGETFKIQVYVPNKDISNVDIGDKMKYRFQALPYKEYGVLEGIITNISVDAKFNQEQGQSFYLVEADVENKALVSYKGTKANIKVGMALEAQVITKTKKVLFYLLEKIDLWG